MNKEALRLAAAIDVTNRAAVRLRQSLSKDAALIAGGIEVGDDANDDQLRAIDAFVQRYEQYFEHITQRLFPAIYRAEEFGARPPMLRRLSVWLEEVGAIGPALEWAERSELRNRLIHEYPLEGAERAVALNAALVQSRAMLIEVEKILAYINERKLLEDDA